MLCIVLFYVLTATAVLGHPAVNTTSFILNILSKPSSPVRPGLLPDIESFTASNDNDKDNINPLTEIIEEPFFDTLSNKTLRIDTPEITSNITFFYLENNEDSQISDNRLELGNVSPLLTRLNFTN